jgi:hypothetical protein
MTRNRALKIVNPLLGLALLTQVATGFLIRKYPDPLVEVHEVGGVVVAVLAAVHLALNWGWVRMTFLPPRGRAGVPQDR